ncbi:hypothetical protein PYCCODRAFT_1439243 [Trametes coccinea BRFM310]|uniref:Uncharacterized protein n=1 Tax=Trametes coccinea (strain BRFM310) TaxID=1353009 RepID=A0A1Y2IF81_TRAC3|nr:hypothetical protein PYCCODRAFT_1439243 [Trametes coccinea BRFM310]
MGGSRRRKTEQSSHRQLSLSLCAATAGHAHGLGVSFPDVWRTAITIRRSLIRRGPCPRESFLHCAHENASNEIHSTACRAG